MSTTLSTEETQKAVEDRLTIFKNFMEDVIRGAHKDGRCRDWSEPHHISKYCEWDKDIEMTWNVGEYDLHFMIEYDEDFPLCTRVWGFRIDTEMECEYVQSTNQIVDAWKWVWSYEKA